MTVITGIESPALSLRFQAVTELTGRLPTQIMPSALDSVPVPCRKFIADWMADGKCWWIGANSYATHPSLVLPQSRARIGFTVCNGNLCECVTLFLFDDTFSSDLAVKENVQLWAATVERFKHLSTTLCPNWAKYVSHQAVVEYDRNTGNTRVTKVLATEPLCGFVARDAKSALADADVDSLRRFLGEVLHSTHIPVDLNPRNVYFTPGMELRVADFGTTYDYNSTANEDMRYAAKFNTNGYNSDDVTIDRVCAFASVPLK